MLSTTINLKRTRKKQEEQERKIVRLQNKTNSQLYELLEGNDRRDINKISGPHRISSKQLEKIYKEIGYDNQDETNNTDETHTSSEENGQMITDDDGEHIAIAVNPPKHVISNKRSIRDSLNSGGIA